MGRFKRVFVIVIDSLGVGPMPDSGKIRRCWGRYAGTYRGAHGAFSDPQPGPAGASESASAERNRGFGAPGGILREIKRDQQREGYHDRTLGDDGCLYREAV